MVIDLTFVPVYTSCMTRREFLGVGTAGLAVIAALAGTPFRVKLDNHRLRVTGPLHYLCRVRFNEQPVKPVKRGLIASCFDLQHQIDDMEELGMIRASVPFAPFEWSMALHAFDPGF